jgi:hypothetical protein
MRGILNLTRDVWGNVRWKTPPVHIYHTLSHPTIPTMSGTDLSPVTLLQQEIQTLTSAMRRNQRWASTSTSSYQSSSAPLPPAFRPHGSKRSRGDSSGSRRGRASGEGVEEGDLMLGFVELRRILGPVKGSCYFGSLEADRDRYPRDHPFGYPQSIPSSGQVASDLGPYHVVSAGRS